MHGAVVIGDCLSHQGKGGGGGGRDGDGNYGIVVYKPPIICGL